MSHTLPPIGQRLIAEVDGYSVELYRERDDNDPQRGEYVECWVTTPGGRFTNSLALLGDLGEFDDGPTIAEETVDRIAALAQKHGY